MRWTRSGVALAAAATLFMALPATTAVADPGQRTLGWAVYTASAPGAECFSGGEHNNVTAAPKGDEIQLWGCGTLDTGPKRADGAGRYIETAPSGTAVTGTWNVVELVRFTSYGGALDYGGVTFEGGEATLAVHLSPDNGGPGATALVHVTCLIGDPPSGAEEGVTLAVRGGPNFNKQVSGETGFFH